ncbi:MAG: hypothetical protein J4428_05105 [Candidatus Aenigmarchaeota archaeon]|nr:hypothetical protein [Candidatus Aenigmarchaeota archaeon]
MYNSRKQYDYIDPLTAEVFKMSPEAWTVFCTLHSSMGCYVEAGGLKNGSGQKEFYGIMSEIEFAVKHAYALIRKGRRGNSSYMLRYCNDMLII